MNNKRVKVNKPNVYHRDLNKVDKDLDKLKIYFTFNIVLFKCKILFVLIFFKQ